MATINNAEPVQTLQRPPRERRAVERWLTVDGGRPTRAIALSPHPQKGSSASYMTQAPVSVLMR